MPKADLTSLLVMVYGDAMANMGQAPDPVSGRPHVDLEQARFAIDLLAMLQEKTHGNRTPDESAVLEEMLAALRMGFVRLSQGRPGWPGALAPAPRRGDPSAGPGARVWMSSRPGSTSTRSTTFGIRQVSAGGRPPTRRQSTLTGTR